MNTWIIVLGVAAVVAIIAALAVRVVKQYELGVLFRFGRVIGVRKPGLRFIIPFVDVLHRVSLRIVTMPIQSQGIITRDNVSVDVSAVAYFRVIDAVKSVVAIENVNAAINQIAQTTLRKVVGQHTLDETLSETDRINVGSNTMVEQMHNNDVLLIGIARWSTRFATSGSIAEGDAASDRGARGVRCRWGIR